MQWKRVAKLALVLAGLLIVAIGALPAANFAYSEFRKFSERAQPIVASANESREILAAALAAARFAGIPPPPPAPGEVNVQQPPKALILVSQSVCFSGEPHKPGCESIDADDIVNAPMLDTVAPRKLRTELVLANRESHDLDVAGIPNSKTVERSEIRAIFSGEGRWDDFYARFPATAGFVEMSQPVLTPDRRQALVYVAHHCDGLCGTGTLFRLEKDSAGWRVVRKEMLWIS